MVKSGIGLVFAAFVFLPACGGSDDEKSGDTSIEIEGSYVSNFGGTEVIDSESWTSESSGGTFALEIVEFSNGDNAAVLVGTDGTYSRNVWTSPADGAFHYCTVAYGAESAAAAVEDSVIADDTDPDTAGCNGFSWTKLTSE